MVQRIMVPLDGSALAESVLPMAAQLVRAVKGTLLLFRVYEVLPSEVSLRVMEVAAAKANAYLTRVAARQELAGLTVETRVLGGAVALNILDAVQAYQVDLLVMGSHGRSGLTRWTLGSVAEKVVRHVPVPVFVLHRVQEQLLAPNTSPVAVAAVDGSSFAEQALLPAAEGLAALSTPERGTLHLVLVVEPPGAVDDLQTQAMAGDDLQSEEKVLGEAERYLQTVSEHIRGEGLAGLHPQVTWSSIVAADIATALIQAAQQAGEAERGALFMALATYGRGGLQRWTLGSIAARILEGARMPLLLVRPGQAAEGSSFQEAHPR